MNYRHSYHAGNFADVFKHIVLVELIKSLLRKENPFCYFDTHAGIGQYDLQSDAAKKSQEFTTGISKLFSTTNPPQALHDYLRIVKKINSDDTLRFYPGSPAFAQDLLRKQDRMILCELHDEDYAALKKFFARNKQIAVHHQDGYQGLKAFLPPVERRGLVLIDPPYEKTDEWAQLGFALQAALQRWDTGIFALWYPIKERRATDRCLEKLKQQITRPMLTVELSIYPENISTQLNGSGMLIINPPWQLDQALQAILPWVWKTLRTEDQGRISILSF